jgi:hypothetical protein
LSRLYGSDFITLQVSEILEPDLAVHTSVVRRRSPVLYDASVLRKIDLRRFSYDAVHALVHYLYTDQLQVRYRSEPEAWDSPSHAKLARFKSTLEIYALARTYEISRLEQLARYDLERWAHDFDLFAMIGAVKEAYPKPIGDDVWLQKWIKSHVKKAFEHPDTPSKTAIGSTFGDDSIINMSLSCMFETYAEMVNSLRCQAAGAGEEKHDEVTNDPGPKRYLLAPGNIC